MGVRLCFASWNSVRKSLQAKRPWKMKRKGKPVVDSDQEDEKDEPATKEINPIVEFSRKEIILKTCTPVKPKADGPGQEPEVVVVNFNWDNPQRQIDFQPTSPLLALPAEIRNIIWLNYFSNKTYEIQSSINQRARLRFNGEHQVLALLFVCRQIYAETALLPYSLNTFSFRDLDLSLAPFLNRRCLAHLRTITSIELVTYQAHSMWADGSKKPNHEWTQLEDASFLVRLRNLSHIRVIVDLTQSLYVPYGARGFDCSVIRGNQDRMEAAVHAVRPDVIVSFWWI